MKDQRRHAGPRTVLFDDTNRQPSQTHSSCRGKESRPRKPPVCRVNAWQTVTVTQRLRNPWRRCLSQLPAVQWQQHRVLQTGFAFVTVCATLKKPWREERNIHGVVETWWLKLLVQRFEDMSQLSKRQSSTPLCSWAKHLTSCYFSITSIGLLQSPRSILNKQDGLNGQHFTGCILLKSTVLGVSAQFKPMCKCYSLLKILH